jgi:predicted cupin superfamily sugar epimerase
MNNKRIEELVKQLHLKPHPEGGYYAETYRSLLAVETPFGQRPISTSIYFLLTAGNFSAFHRIKSDEGWHHYEGDTVHIHVLHADGAYECILLGKNSEHGEVQQAMVPAHAWFASECVGKNGYALVGCTVSPGFDFQDFELADRNQLIQEFPNHALHIQRLTR